MPQNESLELLVLREANAQLREQNQELQAERDRLDAEYRARVETLERELEEAKAAYLSLLAQLDAERLQQEVAALKETLKKRDKALFGPTSERLVGPAGMEPSNEPVRHKGHGPTPQPTLERREIRHELPADDRDCSACGGTLVEMGDHTEDAEEITVEARRFVRVLNRRQKYRCTCNGMVKTAPGPAKLIPGGRYSPAFAVEIAAAKYADHLPLERQVRILGREGLKVTSATLWDQIEAAARLVTPTYEAIRAQVLTSPVVGADETHWPLLVGEKVEENKRWQTWCVSSPDLVSYRILPSRSTDAARQVLGSYRGTAVTDGYAAYEALSASLPADATFRLAHCWAHVRRKFVEARDNFPAECDTALELIRQLYDAEREASDGPPDMLLERRARLRDERSRPIVSQLYTWADEVRALPRSALGQAIAYMKNLKAGLTVFLENPRVPIDNNQTECALRGLVVLRSLCATSSRARKQGYLGWGRGPTRAVA